MSGRKAASTAFSLAVLVLVIVFGVVGLLVSRVAVSSAQAEALRAAEMAAEAGREKLTAYIWKNMTAAGNITMLTLENRGIALSIDRVIAVGYNGEVLSEKSLDVPISLGAGERRTMRLDAIFPGYTLYEDVKSIIKTVLFKTMRGNIFGSTYAAPERFEAYYGATITGNGTTITLTHSSEEVFTAIEATITTISNVTVAQEVPRWDAEIYVVIALKRDEYRNREYMFLPRDRYSAPSWLLLPELVNSGRDIGVIPAHVSYCLSYRYDGDLKKHLVGSWSGISDMKPRPTWTIGERESYSGSCSGYYFPVYKDGKYICSTIGADYKPQRCFIEYFYPQISIEKGDAVIKAPKEIVYNEVLIKGDPWNLDPSYYKKTYFKLQYYIFYDAWNMSNVLLYGNKTEDILHVDRPVKGGFVYVLDRVEIKMPPPPPPPPRTYDVWLPNICISDDPGIVVGRITGDERSRTVTIDFSQCPTCDAYVAPGPGIYDPGEVQRCSKSGGVATCQVPVGSTVIIDADPTQ